MQSTAPTFTCVTCQQELPDSERSPYARPRCKKCQTGFGSDGVRRRREAWRAYVAAHPDETRDCSGCGENRPLVSFPRKAGVCHRCYNLKAEAGRREWRELNREKRAASSRRSYEANRSAILDRQKSRRESRKTEISEYGKAYYLTNKDKLLAMERARREAAPEAFRARGRTYRAANPERVNEHSARYRARKRGADIVDPGVSWHAVVERDGPQCAYCGVECDESDGRYIAARDGVNRWACGPTYPTVDHVIPVSLGGDHSMTNAKLACLVCNQRKGARVIQA